MKSIALIFTKSKEKTGQGSALQRPSLPIPIVCLATYLKNKKVPIYILDEQIENIKIKLDKIIDKIDIIGFSVMTMQVSRCLELSDYIKKHYPDKKIIWGGMHPSLLPEQTISDNSIDYVCQREGERCLYELAKGKDISKIKNLVYIKKRKIQKNEIDKFIEPDKYSPPAWEMFDMEKYIYEYQLGGISAGKSLPIITGRGCIFNCAFCVNTVLGHCHRPLSPKKILEEIKMLNKKYGIKHIYINDDCFDTNLKRFEEFCNLMIKENLKVTWDCTARAGFHWTDERMGLAKKAGCIAFACGTESGSSRILKMIHKPITPESIIHTAKQCTKFGISLISSWISGLPSETDEELKQTVNLLKKVTKICPSCSIHGPQPFKPYPNTELYFEAVKQGFKEPKTLREWAEKSDRGYIQDATLPWIKKPKKLRAIEFYSMNAFKDPKNLLHKIFIKICRLRLKYNFYSLRLEIYLVRAYASKLK